MEHKALKNMTVKELRAIAKDYGISINSKTPKAELFRLILDAREAAIKFEVNSKYRTQDGEILTILNRNDEDFTITFADEDGKLTTTEIEICRPYHGKYFNQFQEIFTYRANFLIYTIWTENKITEIPAPVIPESVDADEEASTKEKPAENTPASNEEDEERERLHILNAMAAQELRVMARRIKTPCNIDECNKNMLVMAINVSVQYHGKDITPFIITREDESKFTAGKVYHGDISGKPYTIISRSAKTVIITANNENPYPRKCQILKQKNTEYIIYFGEFIYSFNEDKEAQPVLLQKKKEAAIKFEIGKSYVAQSYWDDGYKYESITILSRTDKTVTVALGDSLNPEKITLDGITGERFYYNKDEKPTRRNISVEYNGVESVYFDCLWTFYADRPTGYYNRDDIAGDINETLDAEYNEVHELEAPANVPALPAMDAEYKEVDESSEDLFTITDDDGSKDYPLNYEQATEELKNAYLGKRTPYKSDARFCVSPRETIFKILQDCTPDALTKIFNSEKISSCYVTGPFSQEWISRELKHIDLVRWIDRALNDRLNFIVNRGDTLTNSEISQIWLQNQKGYKINEAEPVKESDTPSENEAPYFDEEYYTDIHADNSHPEQDIPEDHEPDTAQPAPVANTPLLTAINSLKTEAKSLEQEYSRIKSDLEAMYMKQLRDFIRTRGMKVEGTTKSNMIDSIMGKLCKRNIERRRLISRRIRELEEETAKIKSICKICVGGFYHSDCKFYRILQRIGNTVLFCEVNRNRNREIGPDLKTSIMIKKDKGIHLPYPLYEDCLIEYIPAEDYIKYCAPQESAMLKERIQHPEIYTDHILNPIDKYAGDIVKRFNVGEKYACNTRNSKIYFTVIERTAENITVITSDMPERIIITAVNILPVMERKTDKPVKGEYHESFRVEDIDEEGRERVRYAFADMPANLEVKTEAPNSREQEQTKPAKTRLHSLVSAGYLFNEFRRENKKLIEACATAEEIKALLTPAGFETILTMMEYHRIDSHCKAPTVLLEKEERKRATIEIYANTIIERRERKTKQASKQAESAEVKKPITKTVENPGDLTEKLSAMKKAEIIAFANEHKISLRSLKKNASAKVIASYVAKKYDIIKNAEAKATASPVTNPPVVPQNSPVAQSSKPSTSNYTSTRLEGRQIAVVLPGQNYTFDFGLEAA